MAPFPRHHLLPEGFSGAFKTVLLQELKAGLLAKRLGYVVRQAKRRKTKSFWSGTYVWTTRPALPIVTRAKGWCISELLVDLSAGKLIGHVRLGELTYRIPPGYWREKYAGLSCEGLLCDLVDNETIPKEFNGSAVFVVDVFARPWLNTRGIRESDSFFPETLRTRPFAGSEKKPTEEEILGKLLELMATGLRRDEVAKRIRLEPGFKSVGNEHARRVVAGHIKRGRPRKNT